jgi:hypothetical protein
MNEYDRSNLNFILKTDTAAFEAWLDQASGDDVAYALELIAQAKVELQVNAMELQEQVQDLEGLDCTEANEFINRVKKESL